MGDVSHVSSVAEGSDAGLTGAFVVTGLQTDVPFVGAQLLFGELTLVLFGHFRTQTRTSVLRMLLSESTQSKEAESNLRNISPFVQICCLENLLLGDTIFLQTCLEPYLNKNTGTLKI